MSNREGERLATKFSLQESPASADSVHGSDAEHSGAAREDTTLYVGVVKWFNESRGFGFIEGHETHSRYGRDVFLSRPEKDKADLQQGDFAVFCVRLSDEGHPQACDTQQLQRFTGTVASITPRRGGNIDCKATFAVFGAHVVLPASEVAHMVLHKGDKVEFCVEQGASGVEARFVTLQCPLDENNLVGSFQLEIDCTSVGPRNEGRTQITAICHVFGPRLTLAGLPPWITEAHLLELFQKHGAAQARVQAHGFGFVVFHGVEMLHGMMNGRIKEGATKIRILPPREAITGPELPAMYPPELRCVDGAGDGPTSLMVVWQPVDCAVRYTVQAKVVEDEEWFYVDAETGKLVDPDSSEASASFGNRATGCQIVGLASHKYYVTRVYYYVETGAMSIASQQSVPCQPVGGPLPQMPSPLGSGASRLPDPPLMAPEMFPLASVEPSASPGSCVVRWQTVAAPLDFLVEVRELGEVVSDRWMQVWKPNTPHQGGCCNVVVAGLDPSRLYEARVSYVPASGIMSRPSEWSAPSHSCLTVTSPTTMPAPSPSSSLGTVPQDYLAALYAHESAALAMSVQQQMLQRQQEQQQQQSPEQAPEEIFVVEIGQSCQGPAAGYLTLHPGERVVVTHWGSGEEQGWCFGEAVQDPSRRGWFPAHVISKASKLTPQQMDPSIMMSMPTAQVIFPDMMMCPETPMSSPVTMMPAQAYGLSITAGSP